MDLKLVKVKELSVNLSSAKSVVVTTDFKLMSILSTDCCLFISHLDYTLTEPVILQNVQSYLWQNGTFSDNQYKLLVVNTSNDIICYSITVESTSSSVLTYECMQWSISSIFSSNQNLEAVKSDTLVHLLKYEAREVVLIVGRRLEVTLYMSSSRDPVVVSILELSDKTSSPREVVLVGGKILVLNDDGSKISVFSVSNNCKLFEVDFSKCSMKPEDIGSIQTFAASSEMNAIAVYTDKNKLLWFSLDVPEAVTCDTGQFSSNNLATSVITAFSKRFPSARQLDDSFRSIPNADMGILHSVSVTCDLPFTLQKMTVRSNKLYFLLQCEMDTVVGVHPLDLEVETLCTRVKSPVQLVTTSSEMSDSPVMLLFKTNLSLLHFKCEPEKIVKELMIYPCSRAAETLSKLNGWQNIQIDIDVLQQGLYKRELDTIVFFLKAHSERLSQKCSEVFDEPEKYQYETDLWDEIITLLLGKIQHIFSDGFSDQFVEHLLQAVISTLISLLNVVEECGSKLSTSEVSSRKNCTSLLALFSRFLQMTRKILRDYNNVCSPEPKSRTTSSDAGFYPNEVIKQWDTWHQKLSTQEIVEQSVMEGDVPIALSYFVKNKAMVSERTADVYDGFLKHGLEFVLDCLKAGDLHRAKIALSNMGLVIDDMFLDIFRSTLDKDIRTLLQHELFLKVLENEEDKKNVEFASVLEALCPCGSFENRKEFLEKSVHVETHPRCSFRKMSTGSMEVGDGGYARDDDGSGAYCHFALKWLSAWNEETRGRIVISLSPEESGIFNLEVSTEALWSYMLEYGRTDDLKTWIDSWLHSLSSESLSEASCRHINDSMLSTVKKKAPIHVAEFVLNQLARNGIFCKEERNDISLLLSRIGRSQCCIEDISDSPPSESSLSLSNFYHQVVHYCLKHKLNNFLFSFICDKFFSDDNRPSCSVCDVPFVQMLVSFSQWSRDPSSSVLAQESLLLLTQHLFNLIEVSPEILLTKVPLPLSIGLLVYAPEMLPEFLVKQNAAFLDGTAPESSENYQQALKFLYDHYIRQKTKSIQPDVSVYELLQGSHPIDPMRILGWQPANPIKNEGSPTEIPHFSSKGLSKYGVKEPITFMFFLKEGQPHFAYLKFLAEECESKISSSRIKAAYKQAFHLGLCNYKNTKISSACVSFMEILGEDSLHLRACLVLSNLLHHSKVRNPVGIKENLLIMEQTSSIFIQAMEQHEVMQELLTQLKDTVLSGDVTSIHRSLFSELASWIPLMVLSNIHNIDVSKSFLNYCAQKNDWLGFLLFAQIFQLSKRQVLSALPRFSDPSIEVHIRNSLEKKYAYMLRDYPGAKSKVVMDKRDTRKSFYKKIGLLKGAQPSTEDKTSEKSEEQSSVSSEESSVLPSQQLEEMHFQKDFFGLLLFCHKTPVPWISLLYASYTYRNPVLSVLAASYPESELLRCFATWLSATVVSNHIKYLESEDPLKVITSWSTADLEYLITHLIKDHKIILLLQGVKLFLPKSPLLPLTQFLVSFMVYKKFNSSSDKLKQFQQQLWEYRKMEDTSSSSSHLDTLQWIEETSVLILKEVVMNCSTNFERKLILRHLFFAKIENSFSGKVSVPSFSKLYQLQYYLGDSEELLNVENLLLPDSDPEFASACWDIIKSMLISENYDSAISFAGISGLSIEDVLIMQIDHEMASKQDVLISENLAHRLEYWKRIVSQFKIHSKDPLRVVNYLMDHCENAGSFGEKYFMAKLIIESLVPMIHEFQQTEVKSLQSKMWLWCVKAEECNELSGDMLSALPTNLWEMNSSYDDVPSEHYAFENDSEAGALDRVLQYLLMEKDFYHACQLADTFNYECCEIRIIMLCLKLAKGEIDPTSACSMEKINTGISPPGKKSVLQWNKVRCKGVTSEETDKTISVLEILCGRTSSATLLCNRIVVSYAVSMVLDRPYDEIANERNPYVLLRDILALEFENKVDLAKKFAQVYELLDGDIAVFFSKEIHSSLQTSSSYSGHGGKYESFNCSKQFRAIVKLCQDPSLLGKRLLDALSFETSRLNESPTLESLYQLVDLCVCAHDCFTAACDMEGISQVLHKSHSLISVLVKLQKFSIMVQLFTGIGRYSEMAYVFDILEEHKQFELLFRKGMEKVPNLKLALLDYLKHHPSTKAEVYHMLAYNFQMHREIAEMLESSSKEILSQLSSKISGIGLEKELELVMQDLSNASVHYCKADCLHRALMCSRQAQLVALQLFLLQTSEPVCIINLDNSTVMRCIKEHEDFSQALIIAEAYSHHHSWNQAIFHNVINRGNWEYLKQLQAQLGLTVCLIEDVAQIFQHSAKTENQAKNMKKLLSFCSDIEVKYQLASKLGFSDVSSELLRGDGGCYLQDIIAANAIK